MILVAGAANALKVEAASAAVASAAASATAAAATATTSSFFLGPFPLLDYRSKTHVRMMMIPGLTNITYLLTDLYSL